ncbi:helix-turn-helix domain-containing protein [Neobacillus bataviensis LMG 21833]|uniref:Helix-turn-helix domain-containing protein n=1 Tax=Neobacillus bataviensis LMG 21833 TaxID=1117379 RepID=K6DC55_9BACI|nr:helix-turn-helix domain-containing protein [Neobacillus bataviensis]EKN65643.1 helix-turn-helix domain-containing protein [Neobacillus bataviensis LMG 21833]
MSDMRMENRFGVFLKKLIEERFLSMRKLSALTDIDTATISRIINGKRKATPQHLQKFANCLDVPIAELFEAAGYTVKQEQNSHSSDIQMSIEHIQHVLKTSNVYDQQFSIESVKQQLAHYEQYVQTEEGKEIIHKSFTDKLKKLGSIGPFINQLKEMFERFQLQKGTTRDLVIIGSAILYFIVPVDVIPDYIFPVGFIDDAVAVQMIHSLLSVK